jgi:hypothetical protein
MVVDYVTLATNTATSIGMIEKHYSQLTPTLAANKLTGKEHPDRVELDRPTRILIHDHYLQ